MKLRRTARVEVNLLDVFRQFVFRRRLPVKAKIDYKLSTLCHNFFSDSSPACLSDLLAVCTPSRQLRSSADARNLHIPYVKNLWPTLFPLLCSRAMDFFPFWHLSHSVRTCRQNCVKNFSANNARSDFKFRSSFFSLISPHRGNGGISHPGGGGGGGGLGVLHLQETSLLKPCVVQEERSVF